MYDHLLKFIIIGDSAVGKSNLLARFSDNRFINSHEATIGVEFGTKVISLNNLKYKLQIWDTAGLETFKSITRSYYRGAYGCLLVYDTTCRDSFESITYWLNDIKAHCNTEIVVALVGNKVDRVKDCEVTTAEGEEFAKANNLLFFETSAKTDHNINNTFTNIISEITHRTEKFRSKQSLLLDDVIKLDIVDQSQTRCWC